ncbi:MAG: MBL fold metallo-hydrolase [Fimbriimonadales bacterium]
MKVGRYRVSVHNHGFFRLDGGAMFGSVPKALWAREAPPDDQNRILLATRSLVIECGARKLIVYVGCGDKWNEKNRAIYCIGEEPGGEDRGKRKEEGATGEGGAGSTQSSIVKSSRTQDRSSNNSPLRPNASSPQGSYVPVPGVTDVLLTHLHFDHAGGVSRWQGSATPEEAAQIEPCYPNARHFVMAANLENARKPHLRERASYLPENVDVLDQVELVLTSDGQEIWPGLTVHRSDGHTHGLQWVALTDGGVTVAFPADLIPTSKHIPLAFVMGYDMCAERAMEEKASFLKLAVEGSWIVVFEHDPILVAARLKLDEWGRVVLGEPVGPSQRAVTS